MHIKKFLKDWSNLFAFALGLIPAILLYIFPANAPVPFFVFALAIFLLLIASWLCFKLYLDIKEQELRPVIPIIECSHNVCICKTNGFLIHNSLVSFWHKNGVHQSLIGYGVVENVIDGKTAQIKLLETKEMPNLFTHINNNKENIIIRPTITMDILYKLYTQLNFFDTED